MAASTTRPPIPLTTLFTPPATCLDVVTYDGTSFWQGGLSQKGDVDCYPQSFRNIFDSNYTPGICPHAWTSVSGNDGPSVPESTAFCCPSNYYVYNDYGASLLKIACSSLITADLTDVYSTSTLNDGAIPINPPLSTIKKASIVSPTVWADVIQVQWNSGNTKILSLLAQQTSTSASSSTSEPASPSATSSIAQPTSSPAQSTPMSTSSGGSSGGGGLSTGTEAGIGIGAAAGAVILAVLAFLLIRSRRRKSKIPSVGEGENREAHYAGGEDYKPPGYHEMAQGNPPPPDPVEMEGGNMGELAGTQPRAELDHKRSVNRASVSTGAFSPGGSERYAN